MIFLRCLCCPDADNTGHHEFEIDPGEPQICPLCESTVDSGRVERLAVIHFEPPFSARLRGIRGSGKLACTGEDAKTTTGELKLVSGSVRAVNCPACLETIEYKNECRPAGYAMTGVQSSRVARAKIRAAKLAEQSQCPTSAAISPEPSTQPTTAPLSDQPLTDGGLNKAS